MKLALDTSAVPDQPAGAGRYVVELARRLPGRGLDTTLVTRKGDDARWREYSPQATVAPRVPSARVARLFYEATRLGTSDVARAADVWHGPHYTMPRRGTTPSVVTIHDMTFFTNPEWHERAKVAFFRRAITYAAVHARAIVSVSEYTARLIDELLEGHAPVVVAPLGVDLDRFTIEGADDERVLREHGLDTQVDYFLFVGTFEPRKGIDVLLDAFTTVATEHPLVELWLAGQHGWGVSEVEGRLATHPASARIRRLGFVPDGALAPLLRASRAAVYPSRGEGFGLPVLEALACGVPVVTSRDTVMEEVAGSCATLTAAGSATDLSRAMLELLSQSTLQRVQSAQRGRERAEQFTWARCVDQHLVAYHLARGE
ncbi:MAG: glycosyltransferase family 1 protein [Actinomycetota bacterium]|nr:glycosyltransferase family 1 protein [Actinomycetota bacterium]